MVMCDNSRIDVQTARQLDRLNVCLRSCLAVHVECLAVKLSSRMPCTLHDRVTQGCAVCMSSAWCAGYAHLSCLFFMLTSLKIIFKGWHAFQEQPDFQDNPLNP